MTKNTWLVFLFICPVLLFGQVVVQPTNTLVPRIDSVYCHDTLFAKNPTTLFLTAQVDDIVFFTSACNSSDSMAFQWNGIDRTPLLCRSAMIRYTNIKGGNYTFSIGRMENDTFKTKFLTLPVTAEYTITEQPLFIPSLVFALLVIFATIIYLWLMYNFRQKIKVQGLRNQIAADLHDEVGSTLSSIAVMSKVLRKSLSVNAPDSLPILDKILATSRETIMNLRDTVWSINPDNDSLERLIEKMRSFAYEMLVSEEITLTYHNELDEKPERYKSLKISMEQRRNVYLMFKECVHNIVKHSAAKAVSIAMFDHAEGFLIHIKDDGKGFDMAQKNDGNGMKILQRRAKECFIDLAIQTAPQQGTHIKMLVPEL